MAKELICMTQKEISRHDIITDLINGKVNGSEAAVQLNLSVRQTKRLKAKVSKQGIEALMHGNRGKESNRKIKSKIINKAIDLIKEKYPDFGPTLACEKLEEKHSIKLGRETVRKIMIEQKLWKPKPRKQSKKKHVWRARKDNYGQMQQFDGSYHLWLEDRLLDKFGEPEELCLLLSVDDATGKITHAKFDYNESVGAVFSFWLEYFQKNNLPISVYLDKFSTYKINHANAVDNSKLLTQFQRATNQAGIELITAHSPQAKGRVERMFETLQDRLIKELRLSGISSIEEANKFLETYILKFNKRFGVVPNRKANLHKKINKALKSKLPHIFSIQEQRKIQNDYTIMFKNNFFQLDQEQPTVVYKKDTVIVEQHLDGSIKINLNGHYLKYIQLPQRPKKQIQVKLTALTRTKSNTWKPPASHPWRTQTLFKNRSRSELVRA